MSPQLAYPSPSRNDLGADAPLLGAHFRDVKLAGQNRSRQIGGARHHKNDAGLWVPSDFNARNVLSEPAQWPMPWSPAVMAGGIAKTFVTGTDAGGWLTGVAHRPDLWVSMEPANRLPGVPPVRDGRTFIWSNVYPGGGTLAIRVGMRGYRKVISYPGMPSTLPMIDVGVPPGCSVVATEGALTFLSPGGDEYIHTQPAYGWWGAATVEEIKNSIDQTGKGVGRLDLALVGTATRGGIDYNRYRLTPVGPEWDTATGVVRFDPSTDLSGDTETDMSHIIVGYADNNYGGDTAQNTWNAAFNTGKRSMFLRADAANYPTGTYTDCNWSVYWRATGDANAGDGTHDVHRVKDVNAGWEEGTDNHFPREGMICYNYLAYHATTPTDWDGGGPGLIAGTDYDTTAGVSQAYTVASDGDTYNDYSLPTSDFSDWEATPSNNGGHYFIETDSGTATSRNHDDPGGTNPAILTITYTTGGATAPYLYSFLTRRQ